MPARSTSGARFASGDEGLRQALLDEVNALLVKAVEQRSSYVRLADPRRAFTRRPCMSRRLRPFSAGFCIGAGWERALIVAITVLIITCPCALGLAIPAVQVVAAGAIFRHGLMLNSGEALERLAEAGTIVFDKTGTLTDPRPTIANLADIAPEDLALAGRLGARKPASARQGHRRGRPRRRRWAGTNFPGRG